LYAVVDVEGNGQSPPDLVEIAVVPVSASLDVGDFRSWLVRPPRPITAVVTAKVHGIANADVADAPTWAEVSGEVAAALAGRVLVAHNASVERAVLARHLPSYVPPEVVDTLALARRLWPALPGHGLDALIRARGIRMGTRFGHRHRAGHDAHATALVFRALSADAGGVDQLALPDD
jgi:DNA polymerase-3 subunit epsilon/exodeoxyribonuclease X